MLKNVDRLELDVTLINIFEMLIEKGNAPEEILAELIEACESVFNEWLDDNPQQEGLANDD
jgi:hypothetical protein